MCRGSTRGEGRRNRGGGGRRRSGLAQVEAGALAKYVRPPVALAKIVPAKIVLAMVGGRRAASLAAVTAVP